MADPWPVLCTVAADSIVAVRPAVKLQATHSNRNKRCMLEIEALHNTERRRSSLAAGTVRTKSSCYGLLAGASFGSHNRLISATTLHGHTPSTCTKTNQNCKCMKPTANGTVTTSWCFSVCERYDNVTMISDSTSRCGCRHPQFLIMSMHIVDKALFKVAGKSIDHHNYHQVHALGF
jgi:hypothetical protein